MAMRAKWEDGRTAYEVLGCRPDDPQDDLKGRYRTIAQRVHPDTGSTPDDAEFKAVNWAYNDCLKGEKQKATYDRLLEQGGTDEEVAAAAAEAERMRAEAEAERQAEEDALRAEFPEGGPPPRPPRPQPGPKPRPKPRPQPGPRPGPINYPPNQPPSWFQRMQERWKRRRRNSIGGRTSPALRALSKVFILSLALVVGMLGVAYFAGLPDPVPAKPKASKGQGGVVESYDSRTKSVQQAMLSLPKYNAGPADGRLGPTTRRAIKAFQRDSGLEVTGKVDHALLLELGIPEHIIPEGMKHLNLANGQIQLGDYIQSPTLGRRVSLRSLHYACWTGGHERLAQLLETDRTARTLAIDACALLGGQQHLIRFDGTSYCNDFAAGLVCAWDRR